MSTVTINVPNPYNLSQTIPREIQYPPTHGSLMREAQEAIERRMISSVMESLNYNQTHTANALGISRQALIRRLVKYDLPSIDKNGNPKNHCKMNEFLRTWRKLKYRIDIFQHNRQNFDNLNIFAYRIYYDNEQLIHCRNCPVSLKISTDSNEFIGKIIRHLISKEIPRQNIDIHEHVPMLEAFMMEYDYD